LNTTGKNMKLKHLLTVAICSAGLFAPQFIRAQGLVYLSNTNEPVEGTYQDPLGVIQFVTGPNASGYTLTAVSILLGDNSGTEITNTHIDIYSSTPASIGNPLAQVFLGPFPRDAGLHTFTAEPDIILPPNAYYTLTVNPIHDAPFYNYSIIFDYTTSTNASGTGGWSFYPPGSRIGSSLGVYPLFNIFATPLSPPVVSPIALTNEVVLPDGSFQFGFTNTPGVSFTAYASSNLALPFTNWLYAGTPMNVGSNYFQYNSGPGVVTSGTFPRVFFRVTSP
jgi:hypothetical protein